MIPALLLLACSTPPAATGTTTGSPATGTPPGTTSGCVLPAVRLPWEVCVSASDPTPWATTTAPTPYSFVSLDVSGTVDATVDLGLQAVHEFDPCDGSSIPEGNLIQLTDGEGNQWVAGWQIDEGAEPSATLATVGPGDEVTLNIRYGRNYSTSLAVALHGVDGPLVVWDGGGLTDDARGFTMGQKDVGCRSNDPPEGKAIEYQVTLDMELELFAGESGTFDVDGRQMDAEVASAYWYEGCADGCGWTGYAVWAQMP